MRFSPVRAVVFGICVWSTVRFSSSNSFFHKTATNITSPVFQTAALFTIDRGFSSNNMATNKNLDRFMTVMDEVYGKYTGPNWVPKAYKDNKSRYLWTDAFGVCNYITLYYETGNKQYLDQADALIKNVHDVLGKDRKGIKRLDGATDEEPTKGGLRIGKEDAEGTSDGDGQYFHYLTKWMVALNRMSLAKGDPKYNHWAIQMAESIHPRFVYNRDSAQPHMYWKISIDMSKPWVRSEGNLDPYDGYITYRMLHDYSSEKNVLKREIEDMQKMVTAKYRSYSSDDPLDLGEAVWIAHWYPSEDWSKTLTSKSLSSLEYLYSRGYFDMPVRYRLAFREFGTTIGVKTNKAAGAEWLQRAEGLNQFWEKNLYSRDHDITPVMYCTSLIPGVLDRDHQINKQQPKEE